MNELELALSKKKEQCRRFRQQNPGYDKEYRKTINGCLRQKFIGMKTRCNNLNNQDYKRYGGRGIKVLFKDANEFVNYVINDLQIDPRGLSIHRIDNNGHYEPGNIEFLTAVEHGRR